MILKPQTLRRLSPRLATIVTLGATLLSATWGVALILTHKYNTTPPIIIALATATALAWIWRMNLARTNAEYRADEALIRRMRSNEAQRLREEEAFRQITEFFNEGGPCGLD